MKYPYLLVHPANEIMLKLVPEVVEGLVDLNAQPMPGDLVQLEQDEPFYRVHHLIQDGEVTLVLEDSKIQIFPQTKIPTHGFVLRFIDEPNWLLQSSEARFAEVLELRYPPAIGSLTPIGFDLFRVDHRQITSDYTVVVVLKQPLDKLGRPKRNL